MSELPPPLPPSLPPPVSSPKPSTLAPWLCWIAASTLLPALPFIIWGKHGLDDNNPVIPIFFALAVQLACSIWVPIAIAKRGRQGPGFIISLSLVLMVASVAVGTASFFGACVAADTRMDFR